MAHTYAGELDALTCGLFVPFSSPSLRLVSSVHYALHRPCVTPCIAQEVSGIRWEERKAKQRDVFSIKGVRLRLSCWCYFWSLIFSIQRGRRTLRWRRGGTPHGLLSSSLSLDVSPPQLRICKKVGGDCGWFWLNANRISDLSCGWCCAQTKVESVRPSRIIAYAL